MSSRPPHQQQQNYSDAKRPSSRRAESSRSATTGASVDTPTSGEPVLRSATPVNQSPAQPRFRIPQSPRSSIGESQAKAAKVAIPRLKRSIDAAGEGSTRSGGRHRVNHACEPCRHRKTKCSGERPVCRHCQDFKIVCFYADGKRDRVKKQFGSMAEKVADYERLLKDLLPRVPDDDARLIRQSLEKASQTEFDDTFTDNGTAPSVELDADAEASGAESEASGGAGSTGALDRTEEDFTREGAKATGFMGKNSEITWLQRLRQENKFGESPPPNADQETEQLHNISTSSLQSKKEPGDYTVPLPEIADGFSIHDSSYHLDDLAIDTLDTVDPYELPTRDMAQMLFNTYMQRVHPTFPVVGHVNLTAQFQRFISNPVQRPPDKWLAIVNMMFAISAKYSHLIQADWKGDDRDHMIYFSRARLLAINQDTYFSHPDLQSIQIMGLMSFYLMSTSQINRSWMLVGVAIRNAVALGLNMRNDSTNLKDSLKEIRYRLWWSIYMLDIRLCSVTGRVTSILDDHNTTPLPVPIDEDKFDSEEARKLLSKESQQGERAPSSNSHSPAAPPSSTFSKERSRSSGKSDVSRSPSTLQFPITDLQWARDVQPCSSLYFLHMVQLSRLTQQVFDRLYNPAVVEKTWSFIQSQIRHLNDQLDSWYRKLPAMFDFRRKQRDRDFYEFRLNLGFFYYGTKQMVHRPCLCRLDRKLPNQSNQSRDFNRSSATSCVEAAQDMLRLIPDEPNAIGLMRVGPWWTMLPYLVQSASVLMLEISFRAHHMPEDADSILESSKKAMRWLHALGEDNLSAKRAWNLCNAMLQEAAIKIGRKITDLPDRPPGRGSASSSDGATAMSGISTSQVHNYANQFRPNDMSTTMYSTAASMPAYAVFSGYDQLMQYDQYFPGSEAMHASMAGLDNSHYATADPSDPEMEFMTNAYHDDRGEHSGDHTGAGMPGGLSGYM